MTRALSNIRHPARRYITRKIVRRAMPALLPGDWDLRPQVRLCQKGFHA